MTTMKAAIDSFWDVPFALEKVDLVERVVVLAFGWEKEGSRPVRRLRLEGVSLLHVERPSSYSWDFAEASEIEMTDRNTLDIVMWSEDLLTVTFEAAFLDGAPLRI
jgi:hypothetical protein